MYNNKAVNEPFMFSDTMQSLLVRIAVFFTFNYLNTINIYGAPLHYNFGGSQYYRADPLLPFPSTYGYPHLALRNTGFAAAVPYQYIIDYPSSFSSYSELSPFSDKLFADSFDRNESRNKRMLRFISPDEFNGLRVKQFH